MITSDTFTFLAFPCHCWCSSPTIFNLHSDLKSQSSTHSFHKTKHSNIHTLLVIDKARPEQDLNGYTPASESSFLNYGFRYSMNYVPKPDIFDPLLRPAAHLIMAELLFLDFFNICWAGKRKKSRCTSSLL